MVLSRYELGYLQEVRLPDWRRAICSIRPPAFSNMAYELPRPRTVSASIEIDPCPVVTPTISASQNSTGWVTTHWFCQFRQRGLGAKSPTVDCVVKIGNVLPGCTAIFGLKDREVVWVVTGEGCCSDDCSVLELNIAWVSYSLGARGLIDGVVCKKAPGLGGGAVAGKRVCNGIAGQCSCRCQELEQHRCNLLLVLEGVFD